MIGNIYRITTYKRARHLGLFRFRGKWWTKTLHNYAFESVINGAPVHGRIGELKLFNPEDKVGVKFE